MVILDSGLLFLGHPVDVRNAYFFNAHTGYFSTFISLINIS